MTLLVEDGTGVADANTFVTLDDARAYGVDRGVVLPIDETLSAYLVKGTDWLKTLTYLGTKIGVGPRYLPWPRSGIEIDAVELPDDEVPTAIVAALCQLAIEQAAGVVLQASFVSGSAVKREKIGPIETEYVVGSVGSARARIPIVMTLLAGYIRPLAGGLNVGRG